MFIVYYNTDPDKYVYSGYNIGFDTRSQFSWPNYTWGTNAVIFGVDMSSSIHLDEKKNS